MSMSDETTSRPVEKSDRLSSGHSGAYFDFDVLDRIKEHEARGFCRPMKEPVSTVSDGHLEGQVDKIWGYQDLTADEQREILKGVEDEDEEDDFMGELVDSDGEEDAE